MKLYLIRSDTCRNNNNQYEHNYVSKKQSNEHTLNATVFVCGVSDLLEVKHNGSQSSFNVQFQRNMRHVQK